jgi:predicted RNase H-like nuclease (RuvC/YqgF family)
MNNVHRLSVSIPKIEDYSSSFGISSRLNRLQDLVANCTSLVEQRGERQKMSQLDVSSEVTPPFMVQVDTAKESTAIQNLQEENEILKTAMRALRDCLFIEIRKREDLEREVKLLSSKLSKSQELSQKRAAAKPLKKVRRRSDFLEKTLHYELPIHPSSSNSCNSNGSVKECPIFLHFSPLSPQ